MTFYSGALYRDRAGDCPLPFGLEAEKAREETDLWGPWSQKPGEVSFGREVLEALGIVIGLRFRCRIRIEGVPTVGG